MRAEASPALHWYVKELLAKMAYEYLPRLMVGDACLLSHYCVRQMVVNVYYWRHCVVIQKAPVKLLMMNELHWWHLKGSHSAAGGVEGYDQKPSWL